MMAQPQPLLTEQEQNTLFKLLLNSWSAEYALRLTPLNTADDDFIRSSTYWMLPQAYYAVYLSLRAVLLSFGRVSISDELVKSCGQVLRQQGLYDQADLPADFFEQLSALRLPDDIARTAARILEQQIELISLIDRVQFTHEQHILGRLGLEAYASLINRLPGYLQEGFLSDRLARLLTPEPLTA